MLLSLLYLALRGMLRLLPSGGDSGREIEILILRHQVKVLRRRAGRPKLRRLDRLLFAAAARRLPKDRWASFIVGPQTLLRWHRELVKRKWTSWGSCERSALTGPSSSVGDTWTGYFEPTSSGPRGRRRRASRHGKGRVVLARIWFRTPTGKGDGIPRPWGAEVKAGSRKVLDDGLPGAHSQDHNGPVHRDLLVSLPRLVPA